MRMICAYSATDEKVFVFLLKNRNYLVDFNK